MECRDKIARLSTINKIEHGSLSLTDFETSVKSLRLMWIPRALNGSLAPWKAYFEYTLFFV